MLACRCTSVALSTETMSLWVPGWSNSVEEKVSRPSGVCKMPLNQLSVVQILFLSHQSFPAHQQMRLPFFPYATCRNKEDPGYGASFSAPVHLKLWFLYHHLHLILSLAMVSSSTHCFSNECSHFLDVDFSLITQTMRHSVNCQGLIWPVGLMR